MPIRFADMVAQLRKKIDVKSQSSLRIWLYNFERKVDMKLEVCEMQPGDRDGKAYVHYQSVHETYADLMDAEYLKRQTFEKCMETARKDPTSVLVAKADGKVVGFAGYGTYVGADLEDFGEVYSLYVLSEYHGQKIGYALLNTALERLKEYDNIALWVLRGNERAIRFYEQYGFRFDGVEQEILLGTLNYKLRMVYERNSE